MISSTSRPSIMLRRSNSTSHIPLFKSDARARSKSSARNSGNKGPRAGSVDRLPVLKRSVSSTALKKSTITTPLQSRPPSFKRSTSKVNTPLSARSTSRSPSRFGSGKKERKVGDKKWVSEQYAKVRRFLQEHSNCHDHIADNIKPPTINTFVYVMGLLFKEIDLRVEVNMNNYKDVVMHRLKLMNYPGNVSNSLLKTVNTMHAWPQVISIFSWLVDLIRCIHGANTPVEPPIEHDFKQKKREIMMDFITSRYKLYNNNQDQTEADAIFEKKFEEILNIDDTEIDRLNREISNLNNLKEKQMVQLREIDNENNALKKQIDGLQYEIDTFYIEDEEKRKEMDHVIEFLKERKTRLNEAIKEKQENIAKMNEAIKKQPCTYEEKIKIQKHIEEMKHTLDLKKEYFRAMKELKADQDSKLAEAKKKVETEIYRLNQELMRLVVIEPKLKVLQLRETNFASKDFGDHIKAFIEDKTRIEKEIRDEIATKKTHIAQITLENERGRERLAAMKEKLAELRKLRKEGGERIKKYERELEMARSKREHERKLFEEKIRNLEESQPDVTAARLELALMRETKTKKRADLDRSMRATLEFFSKTYDEIMEHFGQVIEIRNRIFDHLAERLNQVRIEQEKIVTDLEKLLSVGECDADSDE